MMIDIGLEELKNMLLSLKSDVALIKEKIEILEQRSENEKQNLEKIKSNTEEILNIGMNLKFDVNKLGIDTNKNTKVSKMQYLKMI